MSVSVCVFARTGEYGLGVVRSERVFAQLIHSSVEVGHMLPAGELHSLLPALCISSASCHLASGWIWLITGSISKLLPPSAAFYSLLIAQPLIWGLWSQHRTIGSTLGHVFTMKRIQRDVLAACFSDSWKGVEVKSHWQKYEFSENLHEQCKNLTSVHDLFSKSSQSPEKWAQSCSNLLLVCQTNNQRASVYSIPKIDHFKESLIKCVVYFSSFSVFVPRSSSFPEACWKWLLCIQGSLISSCLHCSST